jgi:nucleotide-binding universal stress UspA family protein
LNNNETIAQRNVIAMNYAKSTNFGKSLDTTSSVPADATRARRETSPNTGSKSAGIAVADQQGELPARGAIGFHTGGLRTLMVPLDGSAFAERALPLAVDIVRRASANLQIVHVRSMSADDDWRDHATPDHLMRDFQAALSSHKQSYLERVANGLRRESAVNVASRIMDSSDVIGALCEAAMGADLVVAAAHGKGFIRRWMYRSTVRQLVNKLSVPVIVVGSDGSFSTAPPQQLRRVLIALDGSRRAERALGSTLALSDITNAESILLRAVPVSTAFGALAYRSGTGEWHNTTGRMHLAAAERYLRRLTHRVKQHSNVVDSRVVLSHTSIARTIASNAEAFNVDLVAIATRKDAANRRRASVAERLIQFASMPVLIVPA